MNLEWNYNQHYVDIFMPGYVIKAHQKHTTHPLIFFSHYGSMVQYTPEPDNPPLLSTSSKTRIQEIVGTFILYARAIDNTILSKLNSLSTVQS